MRKGIINRGLVKKTYKQQKKHYTQLSIEELDYLEKMLHNLKKIRPSWHLVEKKDILIKKKDILKVIKDSEIRNLIIEYNTTKKSYGIDKRVVLRSKEVYNVEIGENIIECNLCFVISILSGEVITAYYNNINDNHENIDWARYNKNLKVF